MMRTLQRGLNALDVVARTSGGVTAKQLATELSIPISTCYHLLRTLVHDEFLERTSDGKYIVGPHGGRLGSHMVHQFGPSPEVSAVLTRLHLKTKETAYVSTWTQGKLAIQDIIGGSGPVAVSQLDVGYTENMHARASCLAVLAFIDEDLTKAMMAQVDMPALTRNTVTSYVELAERLAAVRETGYAIDAEEFAEGVCCVSSPFFGPSGDPLGSFTVSTTASRFGKDRTLLIDAVTEAASMATQLTGGRVSGLLGGAGSERAPSRRQGQGVSR